MEAIHPYKPLQHAPKGDASAHPEQAISLLVSRRRAQLPNMEVVMPETTIKKVEAGSSPKGQMGQKYLVAGKRVSMRIWIDEPGGKLKGPSSREYETVGYVISGSAKLDLEGQTLNLKSGDSWLVPAGAMHQYTIIEPFTAVEATAPPAEIHGRDTPE
jgi:quercetin dioxygenase-like cupin family protein